MRIDKRLHLVVPIYADEEVNMTGPGGEPLFEDGAPVMHLPIIARVHATPIPEEVIDRYFMVLGQTYAAIFSQGLGLAGGPGVAMRMLRSIAKQRGVWNDDPKTGEIGVEKGLVAEMRRLAMVDAFVGGRWQDVPLDLAVAQGMISKDDETEVENALAFFTASYATLGRSQREGMLRAGAELWGAQITSSSFTESRSSWRMSTATGSSGEKPSAIASGTVAPAPADRGAKRVSVPH